MEIYATNVNDAFDKGIKMMTGLPLYTRVVAPRGMATLEAVEPVITYYARPTERVLFSPARDANPFLHFFESLWMLAGRNDVEFPKMFASRMGEYSDNGTTLSGAYGWRWRNEFDYDQLEEVVRLLQHDPYSRRAVITMWAPFDLELTQRSKDIPCNTQVYVKIRDGKLDIMVTCRSNDMLWGAYGTNVVQFSMLQEYLACKLGVPVGRYTQVSDSFHVYLPPHPGGRVWERVKENHVVGTDLYKTPRYTLTGVDGQIAQPYPLGAETSSWDKDMELFFKYVDAPDDYSLYGLRTDFWKYVTHPMWIAWHTRQPDALKQCAASDWRLAAQQWLERHAAQSEVRRPQPGEFGYAFDRSGRG